MAAPSPDRPFAPSLPSTSIQSSKCVVPGESFIVSAQIVCSWAVFRGKALVGVPMVPHPAIARHAIAADDLRICKEACWTIGFHFYNSLSHSPKFILIQTFPVVNIFDMTVSCQPD